jgi:hypothetical protein
MGISFSYLHRPKADGMDGCQVAFFFNKWRWERDKRKRWTAAGKVHRK